ncbi:hypothetical protein FGG08_000486 [Glutinoglossum americanum]|uniref:Uncharacterized protein n=1 Tax=Glutinoglossum americanum TaxID=1670608 RepID=A0A9P8ICY9_9PEZI|nr:hypothetical protein FGG08_000486 [Glutinoglossum americanum]
MPRVSRPTGPMANSEPSPPTRADRCCLRCAKRYAVDPAITCVRPNRHQKCSRCRRLSTQCHPVSHPPRPLLLLSALPAEPSQPSTQVPPGFSGRLYRLQEGAASQVAAVARVRRPRLSTTARAAAEANLEHQTTALAHLQRTFTSSVEAFLRRSANISAEERLLAQVTRVANILEHIMVAKYRHLHLEIPQLMGEEEEEEEEGEGSENSLPA